MLAVCSRKAKTASHARFDKGMVNNLLEPPPDAQLLHNMSNSGGIVPPNSLNLPVIDLQVSGNPFNCLDAITQSVIGEHPTLGFEIKECRICR